MNKSFYTLFLFFFSLAQLFAQDGLVFKHITSENGLSHNTIHAIYKDRYGFMWFGTESGLNKYDGIHFTIYNNNPKDTTSIISDHIAAIGEDSYNNLWFGSDFGLSRYDRKRDIFENYSYHSNSPYTISSNKIRAIFEDSNKKLWIATSEGGINVYNRKKNGFDVIRYDPQNPNSPGSDHITSIAEDSKGNIWFGSSEIMLCKFSPKDGKFTNFAYKHSANLNLNMDISYKICIDSDDDIWLSSEIGLFKFDHRSNTFTHFTDSGQGIRLNSNITTGLVEYKKGIIYILTDHGGLNILNKYTGEIKYVMKNMDNPNSLSNNQLYTIFKTSPGQIWIGTFFGGLNLVDELSTKFQKLQNLTLKNKGNNPTNSVLCICEDTNGEIWIGYDGQGLLIFNRNMGTLQNFEQYSGGNSTLNNKAITDIIRDKNGNIWIATYQWGIYMYDWESKKISSVDYGYGQNQDVPEKSIKTIALDKFDNLYIGTMNVGVISYNLKSKSQIRYRLNNDDHKGLSGDVIYKILVSSDQKVWIGSYTGLDCLNPKSGKITKYKKNINNQIKLTGSNVNDIYEDKNGTLWFGSGEGLFRYDKTKQQLVKILDKNKLKSKNIFGILSDKNKNLWLGTDVGIIKCDLLSQSIDWYSVKDGLQGKIFSTHSSFSDSKGFLYFGGSNGLNIFRPENIKKDSLPPPVFFTSFSLFYENVSNKDFPEIISEQINFAHEINLSYTQNNFSFGFAALSYPNPELNQYAYKLEGFDNDWVYIGTQNEITFTNLNNGQYNLRVKAANSDGTWNQRGISIKIYIAPPFWKTVWFKFLVIASILFLFAVFYYVRLKQIKNRNILLEKMVKERSGQLYMKNNELEIQNENLLEINALLEEKQQQIEEQSESIYNQRNEFSEANSQKDKMFSIIAHDLRGPFSSLVGLSDLLIETYDLYSDEKKLHTFKIINQSLLSIFDLLENLLNWSRAQRGIIDFRPQKTDLIELLKTNLRLSENQINSKKIQIKEEFEQDQHFVNLDVDLINTIIRNLLNNAIKYSDLNGIITIGFCISPEKTKVWIKDNGLGIPAENIDKLFNKKINITTPGTHNEKGTGLGLLLCKEFIEKHNGEIWVESQDGQGSCFYFTIPNIEDQDQVKN